MKVIMLLVCCALMGLSACAAPRPVPSVGLYGDTAGQQDVKGSREQAMATRTMPYTADEVMDAAETALFRKGFNVEEKNAKKGRITASGMYQHICGSGPCMHSYTVAVYVKQTSPKPTTQLTVLTDRHSMLGGSNEYAVANDFAGEIQKVLTTYK
jgi:hypothetical protein